MHTMPLARTRGRAWILIALLLALVASLVVAGCGGGSGDGKAGSSAGAAADYVPAAAPMYFEISTDTSGAQWTQLIALAKRFPAYPELQKKITESLSKNGIKYDEQVKPLLGAHAAVAVLKVPDVSSAVSQLPGTGTTTGAAPAQAPDTPDVLVVVEIASGKRAQVEQLLKDNGAKQTGTADGATLFSNGSDMYAAVTDDAVLVAGTQADLNAGLDAKKGGSGQQLSGSDQFKKALDALPGEPFAQGYVNLAAVSKALVAATPQLAQLGGQLPQTGSMAMSLTAEENGVRMKAVMVDAPEAAAQQTTFTPELVKQVPQDAIAYVGAANLAGTVQTAIGQVQGASPDVQKQLQAFTAQFTQVLGVSLDDLKALTSGEHALVVTKGRPVPTVALVLQVPDGQKAKADLDKLAVSVPKLIRQFSSGTTLPAWRDVQLGDVQGRQMPISPQAGVVYGVKGTTAVIGTLPDGVTQVLNPTTTLDQDAAFQAATAPIKGEKVAGIFWLNVEEGLPLLDAAGAFQGADGQKALDNLRPVKNIVAWATGGSEPTFEAFITIKK